jgi:uncharacterized damage-inducible protein DinB
MSTTEVSRIVELSQQTFNGEPWYGTALCKLLAGVSPEMASAHPIAGGHNIWQQVLHCITWRKVALRLLEGEKIPPVTEEENWPTPPITSAAAWQQALDELTQTQVSFETALAAMTDERLSEKAADKPFPFTFYRLLHGVIQHDAYHAGQIALLKKAAS